MKVTLKFQFAGYFLLIGKVAGISKIMTTGQPQANEIYRLPLYAGLPKRVGCIRIHATAHGIRFFNHWSLNNHSI